MVPLYRVARLGNNMYSVTETPDSKILFVMANCRKKFVSDGKLVKLNTNGIAVLDKDAKIGVCKVLPFVMHQIRMTKNKQLLHHNSVIVNYGLGEQIPFDEEELLLASLEVLETL